MKINYLILILILLFSATGTQAQEASFEVFCRTLPEYQPAGGAEGADYVPGVDLDGNAVVSADLNPQPEPIFDTIQIPITIDIIERFELVMPSDFELKTDVAALAIHKDGRVTYNGQDLTRKAYSVCTKNSSSLSKDSSQP